MAENLERDKLFASVAMLSGDSALGPYGETRLRQLQAARHRKSSIGDGFILDSETGEVARDPGYAEYERERDEVESRQRQQMQADMMSRLGYSADRRASQPRYTTADTEGGVVPVQYNPNAPGGAGASEVIPIQRPLSNDDRQRAAEAERLAAEARSLFGALESTRGAISSPKDIATELTSKVPGVGRGASRVMQEGMYSPQQLSVKTRGARFEQNLSNLAAGLALTGYEIEQRDKWSPFATGISQEESQRRLENIERDFGTRRDTIRGANSTLPATIHPRGEIRTINGKQYEKVAGEWYERN